MVPGKEETCMKPRLQDKDVLTAEETIELFNLSRRKFSALVGSGSHDFLIRYYGNRRLIIREAFGIYLSKHPELKRR